MRRLTQSLLELARYDAGQEPLDRCRFDLAEQNPRLPRARPPAARERGIQIQPISPDRSARDADRLSRVITNLLTQCHRIQARTTAGSRRTTPNKAPRGHHRRHGRGISAERPAPSLRTPSIAGQGPRRGRPQAPRSGHLQALVDAMAATIEISSQSGRGW